uniref:Uncharacterized protein n=1 Tax=Hippocampus comes TaxID=109280 RepID=A0A3Q2XGE4_HIPCM
VEMSNGGNGRKSQHMTACVWLRRHFHDCPTVTAGQRGLRSRESWRLELRFPLGPLVKVWQNLNTTDHQRNGIILWGCLSSSVIGALDKVEGILNSLN